VLTRPEFLFLNPARCGRGSRRRGAIRKHRRRSASEHPFVCEAGTLGSGIYAVVGTAGTGERDNAWKIENVSPACGANAAGGMGIGMAHQTFW